MSFQESYRYGLAGESLIARWFRRRGYSALPVYEKIIDNGKGPRLYTPQGTLIAPDLLVLKQGSVFWIEAKHKTAFSWHRKTRRWVTGIDIRHYEDYLRVDRETPWPVWLIFLHEGGQAKDSPPKSPAGLFGNAIAKLRLTENHRHSNWGRSGMVYWALDSLIKIATIEEVSSVQNLPESGSECAQEGEIDAH